MSDATPPEQVSIDLSFCTSCSARIGLAGVTLSRHAMPCGHVLCKDCVSRIEGEQKTGRVVCGSAGCSAVLRPVAQFPTAWCTQRSDRVAAELAVTFADQGDSPSGAAAAASAVSDPPGRADRAKFESSIQCQLHHKQFSAFDLAAQEPLCVDCIAARPAGAGPTSSIAAFAAATDAAIPALTAGAKEAAETLRELKLDASTLSARLAEWEALETARITAWEEREVAKVRAAAAESRALVRSGAEFKRTLGNSLLQQRLGLLASIEEAQHELSAAACGATDGESALIRGGIARDLTALIGSVTGIPAHVPSAGVTEKILSLACLADEFGDEKAAEAAGHVGWEALPSLDKQMPRLRERLTHVRGMIPWTIDSGHLTRRINAMAAIDEETVVLAYEGNSPLEMWSLTSRSRVRSSAASVVGCFSLAPLSPGYFIASHFSTTAHGTCMTIFDTASGSAGAVTHLSLHQERVILTRIDDSLVGEFASGHAVIWGIEQTPQGPTVRSIFPGSVRVYLDPVHAHARFLRDLGVCPHSFSLVHRFRSSRNLGRIVSDPRVRSQTWGIPGSPFTRRLPSRSPLTSISAPSTASHAARMAFMNLCLRTPSCSLAFRTAVL